MKITPQATGFNTQQYKPELNNNKIYNAIPQQTPSFTSKSRFFEPVGQVYKNIGYFLGKHITTPLLNSKPLQKLADSKFLEKEHKKDLLFIHMAAVGSILTSGTYAVRTLNNDKLDKDRRNTLAINQVLTTIVSTVGMYGLDRFLNKWTNPAKAWYAGRALKDKNFKNNFKDSKIALTDYIKNNYIESKGKSFVEGLNKQVRGLELMKKMIIFGLVYRYLVPVLIVPIANKLGDKHIKNKKAKEAAAKTAQV